MPIEVPTYEEHEDLANRVADLQSRVDSLELRVTALEDAGTEIPPNPVDPPEPSVGAVTVHLNGADYVYDPASGTDMGDYLDPDGRFVMSCVRVTRDDCPLVLDFRATDAWSCIIFEYSDPLNGECPNLVYDVTIDTKDTDINIDISDHWANASWRWQSVEWPHPLTPLETLYERKLLPRHDAALALGKAGTLTNVSEAPPMSLCGFTPDMPMTGGRADIGVLTGWQAEWLCTQSSDMLKTVLVQGEAAFNWKFRDKDTGAIFDAIREYPKASLHWGNGPSGNPQVYHGTGWHPGLDSAHSPACYYVPFILTGDPYFLEYHQGALMYHFMEIPRNTDTVVGSEQIRGVAWSLRYLFQAAVATPDDVPPWILPKSIFVDELERQRELLKARQNDGYPYRSFSHTIDSYGRWQHAWWQHDYATAVIAWISMLYPQWKQQRDYMVEGIAGRNDPTSGWCVGYPTSYWTNTTAKNDYAPELSFKTWAEAWEYNANNVYTDTPGGVCPTLESTLEKNTTYDYFSAMMHALRLSAQAGSDRANATLASLDKPWNDGLSQYGYTEYKYCGAPPDDGKSTTRRRGNVGRRA